MKEIEYYTYEQEGDEISTELLELIRNKCGDYIAEKVEESNVKIRTVQTPFILPGNEFDLREANNDTEEINAKAIKCVSFTGGCFYKEYVKEDVNEDSYIINGNDEEGYNIFNLI